VIKKSIYSNQIKDGEKKKARKDEKEREENMQKKSNMKERIQFQVNLIIEK